MTEKPMTNAQIVLAITQIRLDLMGLAQAVGALAGIVERLEQGTVEGRNQE